MDAVARDTEGRTIVREALALTLKAKTGELSLLQESHISDIMVVFAHLFLLCGR